MPFLLDVISALVAGVLAFAAAVLCSRTPAVPDRPALETARTVGESIRPHRRLRSLLATRLDRSVATGLLLTLALGCVLLAGVVVGVLALLVRTVPTLQRVDNSVAAWGFDHRTAASTWALHVVTDLGTAQVVLALAVVLVVVDFVRTGNRWCVLFLLVVLGGKEILTLAVKHLVDRVRPAFDPVAATLGPSFPSGHSATAAAFYAAAALVLGRHLGRGAREVLAALAVAIAVAVAASRVLLDLHWLSDVIGGLALGWGWFALCAFAFGGRLLRPTAGVDTAAAVSKRAGPGSREPGPARLR
jgi:undecaprenyl-diphosphatase